jgi:UDP-glucose 4-epimerase
MRSLNQARCLVTGGAGYIGSHVVRELLEAGAEVVVVDDLSSGHGWALGDHVELVERDIADTDTLAALVRGRRFDALLHFAANIWVGESMRDPVKYYRTNTAKALGLFGVAASLPAVIFSSTAAVYGVPDIVPIVEDAPLKPINPYGASKMMAERILQDIAEIHGQRYAVLRYFNVAGARDDGSLGEATPDNSHLVKVLCETALGRRTGFTINGLDYPTPDGTCVRDYVHVQDLAEAHVAALRHLLSGRSSEIVNCGYGRGFSVREVLDCFNCVSGAAIQPEIGARRAGDPAVLVADNNRILRTFEWRPRRDDLSRIIESAWQWELRLQAGGSAR